MLNCCVGKLRISTYTVMSHAFLPLETLNVVIITSKINCGDYIPIGKRNFLPVPKRFGRILLIYRKNDATIHCSHVTKT